MGCLYKLDFCNGKSYIGVTVRTAEQRFEGHAKSVRLGSRCPVHSAWRVHGSPKMIVLAILEDRELFSTEIRAIEAYKTLSPFGYNATIGGDGAPSLNPEVAKKIANSMKGKVKTEEHRRKLALAQTGKEDAPETRQKRSASQLGKTQSKETKDRKSAALRAAWAAKKAKGISWRGA